MTPKTSLGFHSDFEGKLYYVARLCINKYKSIQNAYSYVYIYAKRIKDLLYSASLMPFFSFLSDSLIFFFIQITLKAYLAKKK